MVSVTNAPSWLAKLTNPGGLYNLGNLIGFAVGLIVVPPSALP
jgi:hypothetical protein